MLFNSKLVLLVAAWSIGCTTTTLMDMNNTNESGFSIEPPEPIAGLEGEMILVSGTKIAALSSAEALVWIDSSLRKIELPFVAAKHPCWSLDGNKIFVGFGWIDLMANRWTQKIDFSSLYPPSLPTDEEERIKATSWSRDGRYLAVLVSEPNQEPAQKQVARALVFDLASDNAPSQLPIDQAEDVRMVGDKVVVLAPEVSLWSAKGEQIKTFPPTKGAPQKLSLNEKGTILAIMDIEPQIRIINTESWSVTDTIPGIFQDVALTKKGLITLDLNGRLYGYCLIDGSYRPIGSADTKKLIAELQATNDGHLITLGPGPVAVHSIPFELNCKEMND